MRFRRLRLPVLAVSAVACTVAFGAVPGAAASALAAASRQDGAGDGGREVLLEATLERQATDPIGLLLLRITLEPGAQSPVHAHPGLEFGVVEAGELTVRVGGRAVLRPADAADDAASEPVPIDEDVALGPGDRIAYAPGTPLTFRSAGSEPAALLAATILPAGPGAPPGAVYAEGPPSPEEVAGVRSQILGEAVVSGLPVGRTAVTLERFALAAGSRVTAYPGPVLVAVESGALSGSVLGGTVELPAASPVATPGTAAAPRATPVAVSGGATPVATTAQTRFAIDAGEALFFPDGMGETPPLGGEGTVALLRLGLLPPAADGGDGDGEATAEVDPTDEGAPSEEGDLTEGTRVVVAVSEARLRTAPSLAGDLVASLEEGRVLVVAGEPVAGDGLLWYPVRDLQDANLTGFVAADLVVPRE